VPKKSTGSKSEGGTPKTVQSVPISSLDTLQSFRYQGKAYTKRKARPSGVTALSQKGDRLTVLSPDTLVTPIE
jgi:hypothetical protein